MGTNISDAVNLDGVTLKRLIALISFPPDYEYDFDNIDQIQYTMFTQE